MQETRKTRLSAQEIDRFREEGLVVPDYRIPAYLLSKMQGGVDKLIALNPEIRPEQLSGAHNPWGQNANMVGTQTFLDFCLYPEIIDMVEQLIGPDIILWGSMLFCKPAGTGRAVPWHQDGQYWPLDPLATVTVRLAIEDSIVDNGCMRYIPGSHKSKVLEHHEPVAGTEAVLGQELRTIDESKAKDDILLAGQISIHDVYLIHGSNENRSDKRRSDYAIRYMPATSRYVRDPAFPANAMASKAMGYTRRPIWLARGVDRAGNDFSTGHGPRKS